MTPAGQTSAHYCTLHPPISLTCKAAGREVRGWQAASSAHSQSAHFSCRWPLPGLYCPGVSPVLSRGLGFQPVRPPGKSRDSSKLEREREREKEQREEQTVSAPTSSPKLLYGCFFVWKLRGERCYLSLMFCSSTNPIMLYLLISEHIGLSYIEFNWCKLELQYVRFSEKTPCLWI